jgi:hypothetical protein
MKWVFSPGDFDKDTFGLADIIAVDLTGRMWLYRGRLGADLAYDLEPGVQIGAGWGDKKWVFSGGDYTGDGYPDIAAVNGGDPSAAGYGQFKIYVNNRNGGIGDNMVTGTGWTSEAPFFFNYVFSPGDLGADGLADVLARDSSGRMWLYVPSPGAQLKWSSQHLEVGAGTNWNLMTLSS